MKYLLFLFPVRLLSVIPISCMDTMETSVPGAEDWCLVRL